MCLRSASLALLLLESQHQHHARAYNQRLHFILVDGDPQEDAEGEQKGV